MTSHYFIAIPLPSYIKEKLSEWQEYFKKHLSYKQWPHKEDLHITLKFLGAVETEQLSKLMGQMKDIEKLGGFQLTIGDIGTFGKQNKPRVLWAGVERNNPLLILQKQVEEYAVQVGFPKENRIYRPHVTIAKKWNGGAVDDLGQMFHTFDGKSTVIDVDKIVIYQIFPSRSPKYKVVQTYLLKGGV